MRRDFFNRAVEDCVGPKKDKDSIPHSVQFQVDRATDTLVSRGKDTELDEEAIMTEVMKFGVADAEDDYDKAQSVKFSVYLVKSLLASQNFTYLTR